MHKITASLPLMLKQLKLAAAMNSQWEALGHKAIKEQWASQQYLVGLCHLELSSRADKRLQRYLKDAKLPIGKTLDSFDFTAVEGVKRPLIYDLMQQKDWLKRGDNILLFGASELGKTHLISSLGYQLIEQGYRVKFIPAMALVQQLQKTKQELKLQDDLRKLDKYSLLIIDDVGYV